MILGVTPGRMVKYHPPLLCLIKVLLVRFTSPATFHPPWIRKSQEVGIGPPEGSGPNPAHSRANLKAGHTAQHPARRASRISKDENFEVVQRGAATSLEPRG